MAADEGIDPELWYACAGPHKTLPPVGSEVAYFPQGHIEQVTSCNNQDVDGQIPRYNLRSVMPCTLNDIQLSADPETDEVFATLVLCPLNGSTSDAAESFGNTESLARPKRKSNTFAKTLTVSDTSTHGGFSVPRRAAEECLPPLDKSQDPPTQDLVAKDLHGNEWKFRHIFRGQPKRHLLTSGWSHFVSQKRLVAGDSVLFLRSENGQLRIGVRRAPRQQQKSKVLTSPTMTIGVLAAAAHAATEKSRFSLIYNPRSCSSEFIICYKRYLNGMKNNFAVGQRFKMTLELENSSDRRYTGTISGISDFDLQNWQGSPWKSLEVNWDEASSCERQERVSPWEIGPFTGCTTVPTQTGMRKRLRPSTQPGMSSSVVENSASQSLTLGRTGNSIQGQELRVVTTSMGKEGSSNETVLSKSSWGSKFEDGFKCKDREVNRPTTKSWSQFSVSNSPAANRMAMSLAEVHEVRDNFGVKWSQEEPTFDLQQDKEQSSDCVGIETSLRLSKRTPTLHTFVPAQEIDDTDLQLAVSSPGTSKKMTSTSSLKSSWAVVNPSQQSSELSGLPESGGSGWMTSLRPHFHGAESSSSLAEPDNTLSTSNGLLTLGSGNCSYPSTGVSNAKPTLRENRFELESDQNGASTLTTGDQPNKIFGFPLVIAAPNSSSIQQVRFNDLGDVVNDGAAFSDKHEVLENSGHTAGANVGGSEFTRTRQRLDGGQNCIQTPMRSYIKVYKQGAIGRSIDVTKYYGYPDLVRDVQEMFDMKSDLMDRRSGWQLIYTDHEEDVLLVGDDPWVEFCSCVRSIRVLAPGEASCMRKFPNSHYGEKERTSRAGDVNGRDAMQLRLGDKSVAASAILP